MNDQEREINDGKMVVGPRIVTLGVIGCADILVDIQDAT